MVNQFIKEGCVSNQRLSKKSFLALLTESQKEYFLKIGEENWNIKSFNTNKFEVCVEVYAKNSTVLVSVTVESVSSREFS